MVTGVDGVWHLEFPLGDPKALLGGSSIHRNRLGNRLTIACNDDLALALLFDGFH